MKTSLSNFLFISICLALNLELLGRVQSSYLSWRRQKQESFKLVCYMTNWAQYRPNNTKFRPSDMDPHLCTHAIFAFAAINTTSHEIRAFEWNDESTEDLTGRYEEFNNLKKVNPNLKTMLAVGGWTMGSGPFSEVSKNETNRHIFIRSAVKFLRKWNFDGLDLDWEFPAKREGSCAEDKMYFSFLVREIREAFYIEAMENRKEQMLLSTAVSAEKFTILNAYEIENIVPHIDFINLMSYDYHGSWDRKLGHNSPLYTAQSDTLDNHRLTIDWSVRLYLTLGVPLEKLIVGIPFYGRSFTLKSSKERAFGSECSGDGKSGEFTRENGFLAYGFEICKYIDKENWTRVWSKDHQAPFAYKQNQWVGYDDELSIKIKVDYIKKYCLGGAMIWTIDLDDFSGVCSNTTFPLTKSIMRNLKSMDRKRCSNLPRIEDADVLEYLDKIKKWVPNSSEEDFDEMVEKKTWLSEMKEDMKEMKSTIVKKSPTNPPPQTNFKIVNLAASNIDTAAPLRQSVDRVKMSSNGISKLLKSPSSSVWPLGGAKTQGKFQNSIHNVESRAKKLNDLILLTYVRSNYQKNHLLNQVLQDYLANLTKLRIDDNGSGAMAAASFSKEALFLDNFKHAPSNSTDLIAFKPISALLKSDNKQAFNKYTPCRDAPDGAFVRDDSDCRSFYTCLLGKPIKMSQCEKGLFFDSKINVCNWESQVTC